MVHLKPMTEEVFRTWRDSSIKSFAQEKIAAGTWTTEEALSKANEAFAELLPNDLHTEHHYLYEIADDQLSTVGYIWAAVEANCQSAFLYDIVIFPQMQGKGYGKQAMLALEKNLQALGCSKLSLHVFGHNLIARSLYEKLGFIVTDLTLAKELQY